MQELDNTHKMSLSIFSAKESLRDAKSRKTGIGLAEFYRAVVSPGQPLTIEMTKAMFASKDLRAAFQALRAKPSARAVPALAAASDRKLTQRMFDGGSISLVKAARGDQIYVRLQLEPPFSTAALVLLLTNQEAEVIIKRALPACDTEGEILIVLDPTQSDDFALLSALEDPRFEGMLL